MTYLNNPRGRGQQTGYYLPVSRINQMRLMVLFLLSIFLISSFASEAHSLKTDSHSAVEHEKNAEFSAKDLYQDLSKIRSLVKKSDKLRAYNHKMTSGPSPKLSKMESDQIRHNYQLIKELEQEAEAERKKLSSKYPTLMKASVSTRDLAYLGENDLEIALSVPTPSNWNQLIVLLGVSLVSLGMVGVCMKSMS